MSAKNAQSLMEKIALLLQEEQGSDDSAFIRDSFAKINRRLDQIEDRLLIQSPQSKIHNTQSTHPSQHKMRIIEEVVEELFSAQDIQKTCTFEPHNKPCDNCSLCTARGF